MFRLGWTAFGGPAAHIAMLRDEVVTRRGWLSEQHFWICWARPTSSPAPTRPSWSSTPVTCAPAGAGCSSAARSSSCRPWRWCWRSPGSTCGTARPRPRAAAVRHQAGHDRGRRAGALGPRADRHQSASCRAGGGRASRCICWGSTRSCCCSVAALLVALLVNRPARPTRCQCDVAGAWRCPVAAGVAALGADGGGWRRGGVQPRALFLTFLKIGAVLYGSGYVLLAFLRNDFVTLRLADREAADRRRRRRSVHARAGLHDGHVRRLRGWRLPRRAAGDGRHLPARLRLRRALDTARAASA